MAKEYGTAIRPEKSVEEKLDKMADHLNWSKGDVLRHCVVTAFDNVMSLPRAIRPVED